MFSPMLGGSRISRLLASGTGALVLACAAGAPTALAGPRHTGRHRAPPPAEVTLAQAAQGPAVPVTMPPVGLSFEYPVMALDLGAGACPPPALVTALQQLGSPPLSLAGNSQDMTAPSGAQSAPASSWEAATMYPLPASFWTQLHCLLSATGEPLTVGLNLRTGETTWAQQMVAGAQSAATGGLDFSLGNEPDLYRLPNYSSLDMPLPDEEALQVSLYLQLAGALEQTLGGAPAIGPELAGSRWQRELPRVISQLHLATVGVHAYPLSVCATPRAASIHGLLSTFAADEPRRLAWVAADAAAAQLPAIISEANSVSCGGAAGVSDSPASAVWGVRFVLSALKSGFREVRFHFSGDPYDPFFVRGGEVVQRPLGDALVALNRWLPLGASLRTVHGVRGLVASAVTTSAGQTSLILDDESAKPHRVVVRGVAALRVEALSAARTGLQSVERAGGHERVKLTIAPNSVVVLTPAA
jgi:hypothetical protein